MSNLEHFFENKLEDLGEAKTRLLTELEKKFGKERLYSDKMDFQFNSKNSFEIFNILNKIVFKNKLYKINICLDSMENIQNLIFKKTGIVNNTKYFALYFPEVNLKSGNLVDDSILISTDNQLMTMLFAINMICHEMIHMFDYHFGDIGKIIRAKQYTQGVEHYTNTFQTYLKKLNNEGLKIMIDGGNTPFDILNHEVVQATIDLQESQKDFDELVQRLKNGEKFSYCGITPRGTLAFIIA